MGSQSSVPWDPNSVFWLAQKWITMFTFVMLIKMLCCWSMQWAGTWHTKTWSRRLFTTLRATNASCIGVNLVVALQLWNIFLDQEVNKHEDDEKFNYCQWDTTDQAIMTTFTAPYKEYKETLIDIIDDLTIYLMIYWWFNVLFLYRKAKNYQFLIQDEI